jgi:hypothetical protein
MSNMELFFIVVVLTSLYFLFSAFHAIKQYDKRVGLEKGQKNNLYFITISVPFFGFLLTRGLQKLSA